MKCRYIMRAWRIFWFDHTCKYIHRKCNQSSYRFVKFFFVCWRSLPWEGLFVLDYIACVHHYILRNKYASLCIHIFVLFTVLTIINLAYNLCEHISVCQDINGFLAMEHCPLCCSCARSQTSGGCLDVEPPYQFVVTLIKMK